MLSGLRTSGEGMIDSMGAGAGPWPPTNQEPNLVSLNTSEPVSFCADGRA